MARQRKSPAHLLTGLFETHISVAELDRAMEFYGNVLGLELGMHEKARRVAFYWVGGWGCNLLGVWETQDGGAIAQQHFAFEVQVAALEELLAAVKAKGVVLRNFFGEATDVPSVFSWIPAASTYFDDPDGHLLEFLAKLPGSPQPSLGIVPLTRWHTVGHSQPLAIRDSGSRILGLQSCRDSATPQRRSAVGGLGALHEDDIL